MVLFRSNYQRLDLTNRVRGNRALAKLGFSCTNANPGWYYDGSAFRQAAANTCRYTSEGGRTGLLVESQDSNVLLYSSQNNAAWVKDAGITTDATAVSIINGKTAIKYTAAATTDKVYQEVGTFAGTESLYMIVEAGTAATCDVELYDQDTTTSYGRVSLTFSTGAVSTVSGAPDNAYAYKITDSGPNGGKTYYLVVDQSSGPAGNTRRVRFFPSTTAAGYSYWHHAQLSESGTFNSTSPIVTTTVSVIRDADVITSSTVPDWWSNSQITVLSSYERIFKTTGLGLIFASSNGANDYFVAAANPGGDNSPATTVNVGGSLGSAASAAVMPSGQINKVGHSHKDGFTYAAGNGVASANGAVAGAPAAPNRFDIGQGFGALYWLNGRIFGMTIRPIALSGTDLEYWT